MEPGKCDPPVIKFIVNQFNIPPTIPRPLVSWKSSESLNRESMYSLFEQSLTNPDRFGIEPDDNVTDSFEDTDATTTVINQRFVQFSARHDDNFE